MGESYPSCSRCIRQPQSTGPDTSIYIQYTHTHIYIYIYICVCMCVCVCKWLVGCFIAYQPITEASPWDCLESNTGHSLGGNRCILRAQPTGQVYIYIYIYIYIIIYRQTVLLYHSSSVWREKQDASSLDRNLLNFTLDLVSNRSAISARYVRNYNAHV